MGLALVKLLSVARNSLSTMLFSLELEDSVNALTPDHQRDEWRDYDNASLLAAIS